MGSVKGGLRMKCVYKLFISILFILFFISCPASSKSPEQTFMQSSSVYVNIGNRETDLDNWLGVYEFYEFSEPNINMLYKIEVFKESNSYFADVKIDGFQTSTRIRCTVSVNNNTLKIFFKEYLPDNTHELYRSGDALLKLTKKDNKILTEWGELRPILTTNNKPGKVCFWKIE